MAKSRKKTKVPNILIWDRRLQADLVAVSERITDQSRRMASWWEENEKQLKLMAQHQALLEEQLRALTTLVNDLDIATKSYRSRADKALRTRLKNGQGIPGRGFNVDEAACPEADEPQVINNGSDQQ